MWIPKNSDVVNKTIGIITRQVKLSCKRRTANILSMHYIGTTTKKTLEELKP